MKCKFCGAEWEAEGFFCPKCGKDNAEAGEMTEAVTEEEFPGETVEEETVPEEVTPEEVTPEEVTPEEAAVEEAVEEEAAPEETVTEEAAPAEKPKKKGWKIAVAVVCGVLLLAAAAAGIWYWVNDGWTPRENNVRYKDSYTVSDEKAGKAADRVVATYGDAKLTNGELQIYYWMQYYDFLQYYGNYLGYFIKLDPATPLDQQMFEDSGDTWQQYFLTVALDAWKRDVTMNRLAGENGYQLSEQYQNALDTLEADTLETATTNGYATVDELVQADFGAGCGYRHYAAYLQRFYYGYEWYMNWMNGLEPSVEEVEAYFDANAEDFESSGITKDSAPVVDVRHILIMPEGDGSTGEDGYPVYTEEAWAAANTEAQAIYDQWLAGDMTEESFAALAKEKSEDGSASVGGLYENVAEGDMVEAFEEWIMAPERQKGDHGLIRTPYGYHIMYFVDSTESWYYYGREQYLYEQGNKMMEEAMKEYQMNVNYRKIVLADATDDN